MGLGWATAQGGEGRCRKLYLRYAFGLHPWSANAKCAARNSCNAPPNLDYPEPAGEGGVGGLQVAGLLQGSLSLFECLAPVIEPLGLGQQLA
jgi:hypothetical protein